MPGLTQATGYETQDMLMSGRERTVTQAAGDSILRPAQATALGISNDAHHAWQCIMVHAHGSTGDHSSRCLTCWHRRSPCAGAASSRLRASAGVSVLAHDGQSFAASSAASHALHGNGALDDLRDATCCSHTVLL